jgi:hypothetical protein
MDLFKKVIRTMEPILNIVNPQNKIVDSNNRPVTNALVIFLIGVIAGFTVCVILVGQNIIVISKIS